MALIEANTRLTGCQYQVSVQNKNPMAQPKKHVTKYSPNNERYVIKDTQDVVNHEDNSIQGN